MAGAPARTRPLFLLRAVLLILPAAATAQTATATLTVTASVQSACSVQDSTLDFGNYTAGQQDPLDARGVIRLSNCIGQVTIELDGGGSGNTADRRLTNGSDTLSYQLYRDPARSQVWGTGSDAYALQILVANASIEVFGRIPGGQLVRTGTYSDAVNITVSF